MRARFLVAAALALPAVLLLPASPGMAAPKAQLPDATMYCGTNTDYAGGLDYTFHADMVFPVVGSDAIWLGGDDVPVQFAGRWNFVSFRHFRLNGALLQAPVPFTDLQSAPYLPEGDPKSFGEKSGMTRISCEIVSRFDFPPVTMTILAPIVLARAG